MTIEPLFDTSTSVDFQHLSKALAKTPGYNLSEAPNMLSAINDAQAIETFLRDYHRTILTYRSYLKEIERLTLWCIHIAKITISDLKREHLVAYREFLLEPTPASVWCGPKKPRTLAMGPNPDWRPFVKGLSEPSARKSISILDSFFNYLVQNNYLAGNPMAVDKRRKGKKSNSTDRWLERDEITTTLQALDKVAPSYPFEVVRAKYIILTLFYTGLRIAELANHTMGHFLLIENAWFLQVVGKGEKPRKIAMVDEYLDILSTFRKAMGCPTPMPSFKESTPLIPAMNKISSITDNRISQILRWAFNLGGEEFERLAQTTPEKAHQYQHKGSKLQRASAHWLRHSYGTYLVKSGCPIERVRELMGHSDISTTMIYVHIAKGDLHESAQVLSLQEGNDKY